VSVIYKSLEEIVQSELDKVPEEKKIGAFGVIFQHQFHFIHITNTDREMTARKYAISVSGEKQHPKRTKLRPTKASHILARSWRCLSKGHGVFLKIRSSPK
jgi:hypothetical protein